MERILIEEISGFAKELEDNWSLESISNIIAQMRYCINDLKRDKAKIILSTVIDILNNEVEVNEKYKDEYKSYFYDNVWGGDKAFKKYWGDKFYDKKYDSIDLANYLSEIIEDDLKFNNSFYSLKVIEVSFSTVLFLKKKNNFNRYKEIFISNVLKISDMIEREYIYGMLDDMNKRIKKLEDNKCNI